jgi:hypothetical protein
MLVVSQLPLLALEHREKNDPLIFEETVELGKYYRAGLGIHPAVAGPLEGEDKIIERPSCKINDFCLRAKGDFVTI